MTILEALQSAPEGSRELSDLILKESDFVTLRFRQLQRL